MEKQKVEICETLKKEYEGHYVSYSYNEISQTLKIKIPKFIHDLELFQKHPSW